MAKVSIFKIDSHGFPRFTGAGFMERGEAERLQRALCAGEATEILTFGEYKARQDPDSMSERELRVRLKLPPVAPVNRGAVVTGAIPGLSRAQAHERLRALGYDPQDHVTRKTALCVTGENPGSKLLMAQIADIPVKTWGELFGA